MVTVELSISGRKVFLPSALSSSTPLRVLNLFSGEAFLLRDSLPEQIHEDSFGEFVVWKALLESTETWDVIIMVEKVERLVETTKPSDLRNFALWLQSHSRLTIVAGQKEYSDPSRGDLGPWQIPFPDHEFTFATELAPADVYGKAPLLAFSDEWAWTGENWVALDHMVETIPASNSHENATPLASNNFELVGSSLLRIQQGSIDFFDRVEILEEANALQRFCCQEPHGPSLPLVNSVYTGDIINMVTRDFFPGENLTRLPSWENIDLNEILLATLDEAIRYSEAGLFHNDFRPWNLLWDKPVIRAIDFSALSETDNDARGLPQVLALAGTLFWIAQHESTGPSITLFDDFDTELTAMAAPILADLGMQFPALYGEPWLQLSTHAQRVDIKAGMDFASIFRQLLPPVTIAK